MIKDYFKVTPGKERLSFIGNVYAFLKPISFILVLNPDIILFDKLFLHY